LLSPLCGQLCQAAPTEEIQTCNRLFHPFEIWVHCAKQGLHAILKARVRG